MIFDWIDIIRASKLTAGKSHFKDIGDLTVAVFNIDGEYFALEDVCTHDGSRMLSCGVEAKFLVHGERLMCPRHGAQFCIKTGDALSGPARGTLENFPIRVENGKIQVYCRIER
jgi:3-phenylpropionate/trans-cinnamate dioxygenase ferredoxin subunit